MNFREPEILCLAAVLVSTDPVPSRPVAILSVLAHLVVLAGSLFSCKCQEAALSSRST
jgi:hypothetical protein